MQNTDTCLMDKTHTILGVRNLTNDTYLLRFEREDINFKSGQYIKIGLEDSDELREYSIYSAEQDDFIEILIKELPDGYLSAILKHLNPEHKLVVKEPRGSMLLQESEILTKKYIFIASGTGVAPFHSFIKSHPAIDYTLIHGIQNVNEAYGLEDYEPNRYFLCTSREESGNYYGRLTSYLLESQTEPDSIYFICGNNKMVYEVIDILKNKGVDEGNIHTEEYF